MPEPGNILKSIETIIKGFDLIISSIQNARERELEDWKDLFKQADKRFNFKKVISPPGSNHSLIIAA